MPNLTFKVSPPIPRRDIARRRNLAKARAAQRKRKEQANALALENVRAHLIYRQRIQRGAF